MTTKSPLERLLELALDGRVAINRDNIQEYNSLYKQIEQALEKESNIRELADRYINKCLRLEIENKQNAKIVDEIRNPEFVNYLTGKIMSKLKGQANPNLISNAIAQELQQLLEKKDAS